MSYKLMNLMLMMSVVMTSSNSLVVGLSFRCGLLGFLGNDYACSASCWVQGHQSGSCDDEGNCNCNENTDKGLTEHIRQLLGGLDVIEYVQLRASEFQNEVQTWHLSEKIQALMTSRCKLGHNFCESSCHAIGRVTGFCNGDSTRCDCSDRTVTPRQYALCLEDGVCSVYCQRRGFARGECAGSDKWDCQCITLRGGQEELQEREADDPDVVTFEEDFFK